MVPEKVEANERIRATQRELGLGDGDRLPFLCECDDVGCRALIRLTSAEYAEARASSERYLVVEGHPYDGRIVQSGRGYVIAEQ
jgi:hypothetical protein